MRPIPPDYLLKILPTLLSSLEGIEGMEIDENNLTPIITKIDKKSKGKGKEIDIKPIIIKDIVEIEVESDLEELISTLDSVDCGEEVAKCILSWFGAKSGERKWKLRIRDIVKEIGIGLLAEGGVS